MRKMWKPRVAVAGHLHVQVVSVEVTVAILTVQLLL